jgi:hypothetical protein
MSKWSKYRSGANVSLIALMMEAARTSETSVDNQLRTRQYIPEDSELHTRRRENFKSQIFIYYAFFIIMETLKYFVVNSSSRCT